jgi:hypothetical protein
MKHGLPEARDDRAQERTHMSADHDALIRRAKQLMAKKTTMIYTLEALCQRLEKSLDDSEARIVRTRQLLAASATLLQQSKMVSKATSHTPPDPGV